MHNRPYVINTFSYIWQHTALECIDYLAGQGYSEFEILITAPHLWPLDVDANARRDLARMVTQKNVRILSLNAGGFDYNLASPAENVRAFAQRYLIDVMRLASDLGVQKIVMAPGIGRPLLAPPASSLLSWFQAGMEVLVRQADDLNVRLLIENVPFSFLPRIEGIMHAIDDFPAKHVGIVYDVANAVFAHEDPVAGLRCAASRLNLVHLSDTPLDSWRHDVVGSGVVPFDRIGTALKTLGYSEPVVLEIISVDPDQAIRQSIAELSRQGW